MMKSKVFWVVALIVAVSALLPACSNNSPVSDSSQGNVQQSSQEDVQQSSQENTSENLEISKNSEQSEESKKESNIQEEPEKSENQTSNSNTEVDSSWFDDAVFVGDSISLKLNYYCDDNKSLGNAYFLCSGSLGWGNSMLDIDDENAVHPMYRGDKVLVENCASVTGANKVFIMLGMNDVGLYGVDGSIENVKIQLDKIMSNSPNAKIYIQSVTPIIKDKQFDTWNNEIVREFNSKLKEVAAEKNCKYIDLYPIFADSEGNLVPEYCSDAEVMGIHFSDAACEMWVDYLKHNVE